MVTEPTAPVFVSYVRERAAEVGLLVQALYDVGVPTWLDTVELDADPFADEITAQLGGPGTSGALLFVTPEMEHSSFVRGLEAPLIMRRRGHGDGFWVFPVAAGGLDHRNAPAVLDGFLGEEDLARWGIRAVADPLTSADAATVAQAVLRRRLKALHTLLPDAAPLRVRLDTRQKGPAGGFALAFDWTAHFQPHAPSRVWERTLLPALSSVRDLVVRHAPGRAVELSGFPALPAAVAFGSEFAAPLGVPVRWHQLMRDDGGEQVWSIGAAPDDRLARERGWVARHGVHHVGNAGARDIAVLVNVVDDTGPAFVTTRRELPLMRAVLTIDHRDAVAAERAGLPRPRVTIADAAEAASLAHFAIAEIRHARTSGATGTVHLFVAGPAGLCVLLGQLTNTIRVTCYDYRQEQADYVPAG